VFSYGFTQEGNLVYPELDDTFMITAANNFGTAPAITLTPFGEDGQFNNNLINKLIRNDEAVANLTEQL